MEEINLEGTKTTGSPSSEAGAPTEAGHAILRTATEQAAARLGGRLMAAYAIGSLAHGGFAPDVSDVDLALVVDQASEEAASAMEATHRATLAAYADTPRRPLAERLSIFWSDWPHLTEGTEVGRFPATDRLDLLDSGVLLHGTDRRTECARPSRDDLLLDSAMFAVRRFGDPAYLRTLHDPAGLAAQGARAVTKTVLFPVRLLYTAATGRLGRNDHAADWYTAKRLPGHTLTAQALRWRHSGLGDPAEATALLHRELRPLYAHTIDRLSRHTTEAHHPITANHLTRLRATLTQTAP